MKREKAHLANKLLVNLPEIDKALDILASSDMTLYALLILQDQLFDPKIAPHLYPAVENKSDFLNGAHAVLTVMTNAVDALREERNKLDRKQ